MCLAGMIENCGFLKDPIDGPDVDAPNFANLYLFFKFAYSENLMCLA